MDVDTTTRPKRLIGLSCGQARVLAGYLRDARFLPRRAERVRVAIAHHRATCMTCGVR